MGFLPVNLEFWNYRHWEEYAESANVSTGKKTETKISIG